MHTPVPLVAKPGKSSRFRLWATMLFFTLLGSSAAWAQTGLHYTPAEVAVWRQRATATATTGTTNYRIPGDVQLNSPGDWQRIIANANIFFANPSAGRYQCQTTTDNGVNNIYPSTANGCVPRTSRKEVCNCDVLDPKANHVELRDAAFASLILEGSDPKAQQYRDKVWTELLAQAAETRLNFNDRQRWCTSPTDLVDANPGFMIAEWLTRLLFAYDYVKPYLTAAQQAQKPTLDAWFRSAATYFSLSSNTEFNKYFVDRPNGNYSPTNNLTTREADSGTVSSWSESDSLNIGAVARWNYTNRWGSICTFVALWGIVDNNAAFQKVGKDFYKEWLMFSVYPDNIPAELDRRQASAPSEGLDYATGTAAQAGNLANHFARKATPDYELFNFKTQAGFGGAPYASTSTKVDLTIPGNANKWKSILGVYQKLITFYNGTFIRHYNGGVINGSKVEDGVTKYTVRDIWFAQANQYWKDQGIKNQYTRAGGLPAYPSQSPVNYVAGSGANTPYMGLGGMWPGVLFMYGQMENSSANPYRLKIASPANNATFISGDAITLTVDTSKVYALSGVEYYKDTDNIPFLTSTTKPYAVVWNGASAGVHTIKARPISTPANPMPYSDPITITVNTCTATGTILREYWANVPGDSVRFIPVNTPPTSTSQMTSFQGPLPAAGQFGIADNYGTRYRGYLCVPTTGNYTFWIASDNDGELWLSTTNSPANKVKIAYILDGHAFGQWTKYSSQQSVTISLVAGRSYYIEALQKEATGGDQLMIGWRLPTSAANATPVVIPGSVLSPFVPALARTSAENGADSERAGTRLSVFPNPSNGQVFIDFTTTATEQASLTMYDRWGRLVRPLFAGTVEKGKIKRVELNGRQVATGLYIIRLATPSKADFQKLVITN